MKDGSEQKFMRTLDMYTRLMNGSVIVKHQEAARYGVTERSIQRDIDDIRAYLDDSSESGVMNSIVYDRQAKGYRLERIYDLKLTNPEILAICKILLDSRTLLKSEMDGILEKLVKCCVPSANRKFVNSLIANEKYHYIQPQHNKSFLQTMWDIGEAIEKHLYVEFSYQGVRATHLHKRQVEPAAIMNAGMYFYMIGFIRDAEIAERFENPGDLNPTIYRIDRLENLKITDEHFERRYADRFEEGEFRKRIQFMFGGKLRKVRFKYKGYSMEAVMDRLPTARVVDTVKETVRGREQDVFVVEAEVYGDGIEQWFRQQGEMVEVM